MTNTSPSTHDPSPAGSSAGTPDDRQLPGDSAGDGPLMGLNRFGLGVATVLVGLSAGFFFTFEASVTLGLADVSDVTYVETFQAINETVRNPAFGLVFFGSIPAIFLAVAANWRTSSRAARILLAAALPLYLAGLAITGTGNVPLNNDLAEVATITPEAAATARAGFEDDWNELNLLRTLAIGASFASLAAAGIAVPTRIRDGGATARQTGRS
ncbi:MAG: anthrone oxygenase family protein [Microthrixaceae bacterium]